MAKKTLRELLADGLAANVEYADQNMALRTALANNQAAFKAKTEEASNLKADIALFKQEALQAAVREAELRGYIQRTLEDDAVREPAPVTSELTDDQRQHMVDRLSRDDRARNRPAPRRTGPSSMAPGPFVSSSDWKASEWDSHRAHLTKAPPPPRHWLDR